MALDKESVREANMANLQQYGNPKLVENLQVIPFWR